MSTLGLDHDPHAPIGERTSLHDDDSVSLVITRFSHSDDPRLRGSRGSRVVCPTGFSGAVLNTHFPDVYVADNGDVELEDRRLPSGMTIAWLRALADHLEERTPAEPDGAPCCPDLGCPGRNGTQSCTFPGYVEGN